MCENNCPMTFLWRWNDSSERGASQGQPAWWLTKDCLWFDTVISAHKRNGYISYSSSPCITQCSSVFSAPTLACISHLHFLSAFCSSSFLFVVCLNFHSISFLTYFHSLCSHIHFSCFIASISLVSFDLLSLIFRTFLSSVFNTYSQEDKSHSQLCMLNSSA